MIDRDEIEAARQENMAKRRIAQRARRAGKPITPARAAQLAKLERQRAEAEQLARRFRLLCHVHNISLPEREFRFHPARDFRADFAWPDEKVLLEVEGGVWSGGRHTRGSGYITDMEKYNHATLLGFKLLRTTPKHLCTDATIALVRAALIPGTP